MGMRRAWLVVLFPILGFTFLDPVAKQTEEGNALFEKADYAGALKHYLEAQQDAPDRPEIRFNVGDALYKQGKFDEAAKELGQVVGSENTGLGAKALYNLGNTYYQQEKYQEAVDAYKKSLMLQSTDRDAKVNLELALEKLQKQKEDKNQDQKKDSDKQDQNKEGKDKNDQEKQDQNKENQDKQDPNKENQDKQDSNKQDQNKEDQGKQDPNQEEKDRQNQNKPGNSDPGEANGNETGEPQSPSQSGELTQEEAARILDAMKERDADSQKRRKVRISGRRYNGNEW
ncbi:MAG: tetratricopeptide repeat protein [bacterium]|nr:tetratricopeptide repeat protein [bacterium]